MAVAVAVVGSAGGADGGWLDERLPTAQERDKVESRYVE